MAPPKKRDISVIERRLKSGSAFVAGSRKIPLAKPEQWEERIVNTEISDNRLWEMQAEKGWTYMEVDDLAVHPDEIGFRLMNGRLVRGERGHEVLMKMPREDYAALAKMKDQENRKNTFSVAANKAAILTAAQGEQDGARGAEFLNKALGDATIVDSKERVSLED